MKANQFDQFYTNPKVSNKMVKKMMNKLDIKDLSAFEFIEPSAGSGNFVDSLIKYGAPRKNILAFDLEPKTDGVKKQDFLELNKRFKRNRIVIGNPPFGKRSKLAIEFINHSAEMSDTIAMILPKQFNRYLTQKQIDKSLKLIMSIEVEDDAFLVEDKKYDVKTIFQIWTRSDEFGNFRNKRLLRQHPINHSDFESWIHNNTTGTLKYFDKEKYGWDFAVHRQGFYDYGKLITNEKDLKRNRQYLFVKSNSIDALKILKKIDYKELSMSNTQTPGFSKTDFVKAYKKMKRGN